jgi:hypothetical protein
MSLVTRLDLTLQMTETGTALDFGTPTSVVNELHTISLASGTGLNSADMRFSDTRTLSTGANEDLDLAGALTGALGNTLTFLKLKLLYIRASSANTTNITVSRPAANGVPFFSAGSDALVLKPGGVFLFTDPSAAGVTVTAATGDLINIANSAGASGIYTIHVVGASA